jgi:uncharacterized membrane protein YeaQ/YmgE (transglycosylase-associated protein family)
VTRSDHSIFTNILVGIAGAFVGGVLAGVLNIPVFVFVRTLVAADHRCNLDSVRVASRA